MATLDIYCKEAIEFAKTLNPDIKIDNGINWIWAIGFKSHKDAETFDKYCTSHGCETRGVYDGENGTANVRFR